METLKAPQVKFPPPVFYAVMIAAGVILDGLFPWHWQAGFYSRWIGAALMGIGLMLIAWATMEFRRHQTTILPHRPSSRIIQVGPFLLSRNPIYLSFTLIQIGIGILLGNIWILALIYPTLRIMVRHVIEREEAFLKQAFGQDYLDYMAKVRRWL